MRQLDEIGYDLVELREGGTRSRPVIEVRIDRRDGQPVSVADCERVSGPLERRLEEAGLVGPAYVLEVSSPGERPLRSPADWRRFIGEWASVLSKTVPGRFEGQIMAVEGEPGGEAVVLSVQGAGGEARARAGGGGAGGGARAAASARGPRKQRVEMRFLLTDVVEARLVFRW